jgi:ubiquitin C-terminal hydrolase
VISLILQSSSTRFKLTTMVDFPVSHLDMSGYLTKDADIDWRSRGKNGFSHKASWLPWQKIRKPPESQLNQIHSYSLFGVVNHHGRLNSGHYTGKENSDIFSVTSSIL